jgi:hypothetical protein
MPYLFDDDEKWDKTAYATGSGWSCGTGCGTVRAVDVSQALQPLLNVLRAYDTLRQKLERSGGGISDITDVTGLLSQPVTLKGNYGDRKASLTDQAGLYTALCDLGRSDLHMDVRRLATGMPVYYLCRIRHDYQSEHSLIVEDLYRSAGYPMADERFVRMMACGHESYYLRLSQFRESVEGAGGAASGETDRGADDFLCHAGRHVFQAAWHEDQRPGMLAATHFGLPYFRQAIELLYLCLSGELCELRNATNERLLTFFREAYPQPAIHAFLVLLGGLDGAAINDLPRKAIKLYVRLSSAFSSFLGVEVQWGHCKARVPLYKLVFGNFSRLALVAGRLSDDTHIQTAAQRLEKESQTIVSEIVSYSSGHTIRPFGSVESGGD